MLGESDTAAPETDDSECGRPLSEQPGATLKGRLVQRTTVTESDLIDREDPGEGDPDSPVAARRRYIGHDRCGLACLYWVRRSTIIPANEIATETRIQGKTIFLMPLNTSPVSR